ncbi:MAG: DUF4855 domain-containing protein [Phycisphaerae bacterium]|nr:DUF4855 domain-containing protein [Phycisphaerae bacterium]
MRRSLIFAFAMVVLLSRAVPAGAQPAASAPSAVVPATAEQPRMVLLYYGFDAKGPRDWPTDRLRHYLAYHVDRGTEKERPADTLFDTVLWMYRTSSRGRLFETSARHEPTTETDWRECMDRLFAPDLQLNALETAAASLERELGRPVRVNVVLTLPYPDVRIANWSDAPDGPKWDFRRDDEGRRQAVQWYIREALQRWQAARFGHLRLLGFYWFNEGHANLRAAEETPDESLRTDVALIQNTARFVHSLKVDGRPLTLTWIPYSPYGQDRLPVVRDLLAAPAEARVDYLMIQPNYFFARWKKQREDLVKIVRGAASVRAGVELECDEALVKDEAMRQRWLEYLEVVSTEHPGWRQTPVSCYQGLRAVHEMATRPELAPCYDALYKFLKQHRRNEGSPP